VPVSRPVYRLTPNELELARAEVKRLLEAELIEASASPWGAPILFVPKPRSDQLRMVIDYRAINKVTVANKWPIPRVDDLLDRLHGSSIYSSVDLAGAYHQVRITPEDVPKTAFRTPFGHYQFKVLPFGLTNSPATFQRLMSSIFGDLVGPDGFMLCYLDDLLVYSKSLDEHREHLRQVLERLRQHKLYARSHKCHFGTAQTFFLGHIISAEGVRVDPAKVSAVTTWPVPTTVPELRSFMGFCNCFLRFLQGYATVARPLNDLLKEGR